MNSESQNLLHIAAIYRRKEAFLKGLQMKVDHDLPDIHGNTPLHYVCRTANIDLIQALLAGKAKKTENLLHMYPIHMAIESGEARPVELLKGKLP